MSVATGRKRKAIGRNAAQSSVQKRGLDDGRNVSAAGPLPLTVLVVDPHPVVREGLRSWLEAPDFEVVAEAAPDDATALAGRLRPDVAIVGGLGHDDATAAVCAAIAKRSPDTATVVFAAEVDDDCVLEAAAAGARGYLLKSAMGRELAGVLRQIAAGERVVDPTAASALFQAKSRGAPAPLTEQELNVVSLVAEGCTNREIGERLFLSRHTVKEYLSNAMRKLGVHSRVEAVVEASRRGLLEPSPLAKAS